jgi:hypothetical protein
MTNEKDEIAKSIPALESLLGEDKLNLGLVAMSVINGNAVINMSVDNLRIAGQNVTAKTRPIVKIEVTEDSATGLIEPFIKLLNKAKLAKDNVDKEIRGYMTALTMHFGLDDQNNIVLLYHPVALVRYTDIVDNKAMYHVLFSNCMYVFNPGAGFVEADNWESIHRYRSNVAIKKKVGDNDYKPFGRNDAESVTIPIQEIISLIRQNKGINEITIFNAIYEHPSAGHLHTIVLSPQITPPDPSPEFEKMVDELKGKYADLGQLCPPNCGKMEISIEPK